MTNQEKQNQPKTTKKAQPKVTPKVGYGAAPIPPKKTKPPKKNK